MKSDGFQAHRRFFVQGFVLLEIVPGTISAPLGGVNVYRCEAASVEGFIQQLAVSYVGRGYWFYVAGSVPEGKDPREVDEKLVHKYGVNISKWTRARRKRLGFANIQYIRFDRFFILLATKGEHPFFIEESRIRDIRKCPIRFAGYSVGYRIGSDGKGHPSVRIDAVEFRWLKRRFLSTALDSSVGSLTAQFKSLGFEPYAPVRNQYRQLLRAINKKRSLAAFELLSPSIFPRQRRVVSPFAPNSRWCRDCDQADSDFDSEG